MKPSFLSVNGVPSFIVVGGEGGRLRHLVGEELRPVEVESPTTATLRSVYVASEREAWAVGDDGTTIWWNGERWYHAAITDPEDRLLTVAGAEGDLWVGGENRLILHRPRGVGGMHVSCSHAVRSIACCGAETWILADEALIFHADDNGCRIVDSKAIEREYFNALAVGGEDGDLFVAGQSGVMVRQDGAEWVDVDTGTFDDILALAVDGEDVWAGTSRGELRHSDDNGRSWATAAINIFGAIRGVCVVDGTVCAVGDGGTILIHRPSDGDTGE